MKPAKRTRRPSSRPVASAEDQALAESWARALSGGGVEAVTSEVQALGPSAAGAVSLLVEIGGAETPFLLQTLARPGAHKEIRDAARRALYRLTSSGRGQGRGAGGQGTGDWGQGSGVGGEPAHPGARVATLYRAIGSSFDGNGSRALWLAAERPLGGIYFITLTINDVSGLIDCRGRDTTRKRFSQQEHDVRAKDPMAWAELPVEYARQLIQEGLTLAREAGRRVPTGYAVWAPVIGEPEAPPGEALIYQDIKAFDAKMHPTWLGETPRLFQQPEIEPWFFEPARVEKLARQLAEPPIQRLVITPESEEGRVERLMRDALAELLTDRDLHGLRRRLEETALIFQQSERQAEARRAVAAAVTIEESRPLRSPHPFLRALLERSIDIAQRVQRTGFEPVRLTNAESGS